MKNVSLVPINPEFPSALSSVLDALGFKTMSESVLKVSHTDKDTLSKYANVVLKELSRTKNHEKASEFLIKFRLLGLIK